MLDNNKVELPKCWGAVKLGDFVENEKGKKPKYQSTDQGKSFSVPYVDIQAFEEGIINSWTNGADCRLCHETDFLMVWDGSRSGLVGKGMNGALGSTLVRINFPSMVNDYAFYFLQSKYQQINSRAKGSGTPHVDPDLLWNYIFPIAPLNEQHRIVAKIEELFSELEKGVESLKVAKAQLAVYRQSVLKAAFEGRLTESWRKEHSKELESAEQLLAKIYSERNIQLGEENVQPKEASRILNKLKKHSFVQPEQHLPSGWGWSSFLAACHLVVDCHNKTAPYQPGGIYLVRTPNIRNGRLNLVDDIRFVSIETYEYWSRRCPPKPRDILFTREAPMGEAAIIPANTQVCMGQRIMLLRSNHSLLLPEFIRYAIQEPTFQKRMVASAVGTGVKHLRVGDVEGLVFPICSTAEQHQIVQEIESRFSVVEKMEQTIAESLQKAEALRQSILKRAFSGKLVPQDPSDEPASELLARIRAEREAAEGKPIKKRRSG